MRVFLSCSHWVSVSVLTIGALTVVPQTMAQRHNVIIFVADGLRHGSVNSQDMPTFLHVREAGVDFRNSHAVFPTFATANASVIATGHGLGDTGRLQYALYPGFGYLS
jgi:predicted AlkP superfamily pyrophosphatase or phosphodiesterase